MTVLDGAAELHQVNAPVLKERVSGACLIDLRAARKVEVAWQRKEVRHLQQLHLHHETAERCEAGAQHMQKAAQVMRMRRTVFGRLPTCNARSCSSTPFGGGHRSAVVMRVYCLRTA